jgi:hypothetical protein
MREKSYSGVRVDRATVDVKVVFGKDLGALVDGLSRTVEDAAQHVLGNTELQAVAGELDFGLYMSDVLLPAVELLYLLNIDAGRALENLCRRQRCRCREC